MKKSDKHSITRRSLLKGAAALAAIAVVPVGTANAAKASKESVQYQETPNGDQQCSNCVLYTDDGMCQVVEGEISPTAWCAVWAAKP